MATIAHEKKKATGIADDLLKRGAGDGNRTRVMSLEGSGSTIELHPHGRDDRIRTCDILLPKQARYQTAPRPGAVLLSNSSPIIAKKARFSRGFFTSITSLVL